jgi:uncharacterized protein
MCKKIYLMFPIIVLCFASDVLSKSLAAAQDLSNISIATGAKEATYFQFGKDIARVLQEVCGGTLTVKESAGSLANLRKLRSEPFTQFAIVQNDVLQWIIVNKEVGREFKDYYQKFKIVVPLFPEEIHIVTRRGAGIRTIADLNGKRVAIGEPDSGTKLTSLLLLNSFGMAVDQVEVKPAVALNRLLGKEAGQEIDAFIAVGGKPYPPLDLDANEGKDLALVPVADPEIFRLYKPAVIKPEDYRWLKEDVRTVSVTAVLITFDFQGQNCESVGIVARLIKRYLDELQKAGHPKWNSVNLDEVIPGWERYRCVIDRPDHSLRILPGKRCVISAGTTPAQCSCDRFQDSMQKRICELQCPTQR